MSGNVCGMTVRLDKNWLKKKHAHKKFWGDLNRQLLLDKLNNAALHAKPAYGHE